MRYRALSGRRFEDRHFSTASNSGFSLIELFVVMGILSIIIVIAVPAYKKAQVDSRRLEAQIALSSLSVFMERHFTENDSYEGAAVSGADTGTPANFPSQLPFEVNDPAQVSYNLTIVAATDDTFTLAATPANAQAAAADGALRLDNLGRKFWDQNNNGSFTDAGEQSWDP